MKHSLPRWLRATALLCSMLLSSLAHAHSVGTSYVTLDSNGDSQVSAKVALSLRDLAFAVGIDRNADGRVTWGEVLESGAAIDRYLQGLSVTRGGMACTHESVKAESLAIDSYSDGPYAVVALAYRCPASGALSLESNLLFDIDASHRTLLSVEGPQPSVVVLTAASRSWSDRTASNARAFFAFVSQGIWHIWTGYDHLAFLALLLLSLIRVERRDFRELAVPILRVVTAFTVAHSITLGLAALGVLQFSSRLVESSIAASIVVAAALNLVSRAERLALPLAFGFGLIHGLGFASALAELTHGAARLPPLIGFNLGVEAGQLVVVIGVMPLLIAAQRSIAFRQRAVVFGSIAAGCVGMTWFVQRAIL